MTDSHWVQWSGFRAVFPPVPQPHHVAAEVAKVPEGHGEPVRRAVGLPSLAAPTRFSVDVGGSAGGEPLPLFWLSGPASGGPAKDGRSARPSFVTSTYACRQAEFRCLCRFGSLCLTTRSSGRANNKAPYIHQPQTSTSPFSSCCDAKLPGEGGNVRAKSVQ